MLVINILQGFTGAWPNFLNLHQLYGLYHSNKAKVRLNLLFLGSCLENLGKLKQNLAINANIKHIFAILGVDLNIWRLSASKYA